MLTFFCKLPVKKIIQEHYANQINFKTLAGKISIDYEQGETQVRILKLVTHEKRRSDMDGATLEGVVEAKITQIKFSFITV